MKQEAEKLSQTPSSWLQHNFYVPDPRDPITGERLPPGPMLLAEHQQRIIDEALSKRADGLLKYSTVIYSAPKKSGKSAVTSGVMLYTGYQNPNSYIACVANDGKQSADRLYAPIYTNFRLHKQYNGPLVGVDPNKIDVTLPNFTKIEAIPCDAAGEAGSQPIFIAYSELWGFETETKRRVFTELTIPPTLYGRAMRWIETYAGYAGKSLLLEGLYDVGFRHGVPHPDFLDLQGRDGPVVRVNEQAGMFVYWDSEPRMIWQSPEYYREEASVLVPTEFRRIHRNEWVSPMDSFIEEAWWQACETTELPSLYDGSDVPVVVAIDMANTRDCAALVAVTRDPFNPDNRVAVRAVRIFNPKVTGGIIDQEELIRPVIEDWAKRWNVVCWVYDPYQMAKLAQDMVREGKGWFKVFGQQQPRAVADKELHDLIIARQVSWSAQATEGDVGNRGDSSDRDTLYKHITRAGASTTGNAYRIEKLSTNTKIDAAVALSMATHTALKLAIGNNELDQSNLLRQLQNREISLDEFSRRVRDTHPELVERLNGRR